MAASSPTETSGGLWPSHQAEDDKLQAQATRGLRSQLELLGVKRFDVKHGFVDIRYRPELHDTDLTVLPYDIKHDTQSALNYYRRDESIISGDEGPNVSDVYGAIDNAARYYNAASGKCAIASCQSEDGYVVEQPTSAESRMAPKKDSD